MQLKEDSTVDEDEDEESILVLDNGSDTIKSGFAGDDKPSLYTPTVTLTGTKYVGNEALMNYNKNPQKQSLSYPIESGVITDWDEMELIWSHIFNHKYIKTYDKLTECGIITSECPTNPKADREKITQIMMETYQFKNYYLANTAQTSLYAYGRTSGTTVDFGKHQIVICPVWEGYLQPYAVGTFALSSAEMQSYVDAICTQHGHIILNDIASTQIISHWNRLFITNNDEYVDKLIKHYYGLKTQTLQDIQSVCYMALDPKLEYERLGLDDTNDMNEYVLPDGCKLRIKQKILFAATEPFFDKDLLKQVNVKQENEDIKNKNLSVYGNVAAAIYNSIMKCDVSLRRDLYHNVVVCGGNSWYKGIDERIQRELEFVIPRSIKAKCIASVERKYSAWLGMSILSSLSTFQDMWIVQSEYDESGPGIVHRKCF